MEKGLANIRQAIEAGLQERGVAGARVQFALEGPGAVFSVSSDAKVESQHFSRDEIEDSGEAIDAPAAHKVRLLYGPFVT